MTEGVLDVKDFTVFIDINDSGTKTAVACATDVQLDIQMETREILCKDNGGGVSYKPSITRWNGSVAGLLAFDSALGGINLLDAMLQGKEVAVRFGTAESGDFYYEGQALITGVPISSSGGAGDNVTYSANFLGIDVPVKGQNA